MKVSLKFKSFFVFSESKNKYFYSEFGSGANIIHGRNTSGKSTLLQSLLFTFGINDEKQKLSALLSEEVFFRLNCTISTGQLEEEIIFLREDETIIIKRGELPIKRFNGIGGNNSNEHTKLKEYLHELFGFTLQLESKNGYGSAPIETIFLPYYVSQSVGWVYLRKSFSNLDFYKNFKEDYLDYYLGIDNFIDRKKKQELEIKLKQIQEEITFFSKVEKNNEDLQITKISDEKFSKTALTYIDSYKDKQSTVVKEENNYVLKCNELSYFTQRLAVLSKVARNQKEQNPETGNCPTCTQNLPYNLSTTYKFLQEENDTEKEKKLCKDKIKKLQSEINSLFKGISESKEVISKNYEVLKKYKEEEVTFDNWLKNKANVKLIDNITYKLGELTQSHEKTKEELGSFKADDEIKKEQLKKNKLFAEIFESNINLMGVKELDERRFTQLYEISSFPSQGVELLKTVMSYHFAFNKIIQETSNVHRLPFILDAIFKEDLDPSTKSLIIKFVANNRPKDTQLFVSIAELKEGQENIDTYNKDYFDNKAKLICIGKGTETRSFLTPYNNEYKELLDETIKLKNES